MTKQYNWRDMSYTSTWHPHWKMRRTIRRKCSKKFQDFEYRTKNHRPFHRAKARFDKKGKRLPRERLALLLDNGRPFELSTLAGYKMATMMETNNSWRKYYWDWLRFKHTMCHSRYDSAIKGGLISPMGLKKSLRAQEIALENKLPMVSLVESGGANLLYQSELL